MIIEIRDQCEGRENASDHVTTNLGFAFDWLRAVPAFSTNHRAKATLSQTAFNFQSNKKHFSRGYHFLM